MSGLLIPVTGDMMRILGLLAHPLSEPMNVDNEGLIFGLI